MKTLSIQRPRSSMEIRIPAAESRERCAGETGCPGRYCRDDASHRAEIPGLPCLARASPSATTQNETSIVLDSRYVRMARARPVDNRHQIEESTVRPGLRDVGRPDVIDALDCEVARQIRIDFVAPRHIQHQIGAPKSCRSGCINTTGTSPRGV